MNDITSIYLTDDQYKQLLYRIKDTVHANGFTPQGEDSTTIGEKYTETNCGMCNNGFTMFETAMWPDQFPKRRDMKYSLPHQHCPFDSRPLGTANINGCFYTCRLFKKDGKLTKIPIKEIHSHVERTIKWAESNEFPLPVRYGKV